MNKNKSFFLSDLLMTVASIVILALTVLSSFYGDSRPNAHSLLNFTRFIIPATILFAVILIFYWAFRKKLMAIIPILVILINHNPILNNFQFRFDKKVTVSEGTTVLNIASYNIHEFQSGDELTIISDISDFFRENKVDIICFQEFKSPNSLNENELIGYLDFLPYHFIKETNSEELGMAIFSRFPIIRSKTINFENTGNGIIWVDVQLNDKRVVRIMNNHLQTTNYFKNQNSSLTKKIQDFQANSIKRAYQADAARAIIDTTTIPLIVCGDFNDITGSYTFSKIKSTNLRDGFREAGIGSGGTYRGFGGLLRIDFILHSMNFKSIKYYSPNKKWSDHKPVISQLVLKF